MNMNVKTRISATLSPMLVNELREFSEKENISQSSIIERALNLWLRKRLEREARELAGMKFEDLPSEDEWVSVQSVIA